MKRIWVIVAECLIIVAVVGLWQGWWQTYPAKNEDALRKYVEKNETALLEALEMCPERGTISPKGLGKVSIYKRDGESFFTFPWRTGNPEMSAWLTYAPDGSVKVGGYTFSETGHVSGLGIGGNGYIDCRMLKEKWFFVEYYDPT